MKMSKTVVMAAALALFAAASPAFATSTAGDVAVNLLDQFSAFADLIIGGVFLAGLGVGAAAALKFKAHSENAQQVPLKVPMMYALVAALLIGFPAYLQISRSTVLGEDAEGSTIETGAYNNING